MRGRWLGVLLVLLFLLGGLGMLAGGIYQVVVKETGARATARITECHRSGGRYRSDVCSGIWVAGGSLLGGGRVVTGRSTAPTAATSATRSTSGSPAARPTRPRCASRSS